MLILLYKTVRHCCKQTVIKIHGVLWIFHLWGKKIQRLTVAQNPQSWRKKQLIAKVGEKCPSLVQKERKMKKIPAAAQIWLDEFLLAWRRRCHTAPQSRSHHHQPAGGACRVLREENKNPKTLQQAKNCEFKRAAGGVILRMESQSVLMVGGWRVTPCCGEEGGPKLAKKHACIVRSLSNV